MSKQKAAHSMRDIWTDTLFQTMFISIAAILCFYSALWMLQDIFPDWQVADWAKRDLAALVLFTAAFYGFVIQAIPRCQAVCRLLVPASYAAVAYRLIQPVRIDFEDGACAFVSQYLEKWNKQMDTDWQIWHGKAELLTYSFSICALLALLVVLSLALCFGKRMFLLVLPALSLSAVLFAGHAPGQKGLAMLFAALVFISASDKPGRCLVADGGRRRLYAKILHALLSIGAAAFVFAIYVVSSVFLKTPADGLMKQAPQVYQFQQSVERRVSGVAASFLTPQDVSVNHLAPRYTGREVMKITVSEKPAADLYLRGFCGTDYEDGNWTYHAEPFADACALSGYQEQDVAKELLGIPYRMLQMSPYHRDRQEADYTIQYTGLWNRFTYFPYFIDVSSIENGASFVGDASVQKNWGTRTMYVHGMNRGIRYSVSEKERTEEISEISDFYNEFAEDVYRDPIGRIDRTGTGNMNDGRYAQFLEEMLKNNNRRIMYARFVCRLLSSNYEYSLNLDAVPEGEDPIEYFLYKSGKGYCVHFASAAVQLLRRSGVPARYVSGYHVDVKAFHESEGGYTASVKDRDAHAWAEIYLRDIGWIPVDATPSDRERAVQSSQPGSGQSSTADTDSQAEDTDSKEDDGQEDTQAEQDAEEEQQKEPENQGASDRHGNGRKSWMDTVRAACILIALCLVFVFLLTILYRAACMYRDLPEKEIQKGMYRQAVCRANRRIYRRLRLREKAGKHDLTDAVYEKELKSAYQNISCGDWERYMKVLKAAVFSGGEINREDAFFCVCIYKQIIGMRT